MNKAKKPRSGAKFVTENGAVSANLIANVNFSQLLCVDVATPQLSVCTAQDAVANIGVWSMRRV